MAVDKKQQDFIEDFKDILRRVSLLERTKVPSVAENYSDTTRPTSATTGTIIFNTDDGQLNIWDGTNWTLPDGTIT